MAEGSSEPSRLVKRSFFGLGASRSEQALEPDAAAVAKAQKKLEKKQKKQSERGGGFGVVTKGLGDLVGGVVTITQRVVELGVTVGETLAAPVTDRLPRSKENILSRAQAAATITSLASPTKSSQIQQQQQQQQQPRTRQMPRHRQPTKAELYPNVLFCRLLCQYDARFCKTNQIVPTTARVVDVDLTDIVNKPPAPPPAPPEEKCPLAALPADLTRTIGPLSSIAEGEHEASTPTEPLSPLSALSPSSPSPSSTTTPTSNAGLLLSKAKKKKVIRSIEAFRMKEEEEDEEEEGGKEAPEEDTMEAPMSLTMEDS